VKIIPLLSLVILLVISTQQSKAQIIVDTAGHHATDTTLVQKPGDAIPEPDDEFNIFLMFIGTAFICAMIGAAIIGAFAAALVLLMIAVFIGAGIISSAVLVGLYKKSISAGFTTLLIIICVLGGAVLGSGALLLAKDIFNFSITPVNALLTGAVGGGIGGLLMAFIIRKMIKAIFTIFKNKLSQ